MLPHCWYEPDHRLLDGRATGCAVWLVWAIWRCSIRFSQGQRLLRTALGSVGETYSNLRFWKNLHEFWALCPRVTESRHPVSLQGVCRETIRLENVSFRYPGSPRLALDGFDLTPHRPGSWPRRREMARARNTLLKLLCRFGDPRGRVSWDGIDLRELALADWRRRDHGAVSEPVHYHDTVA